MRLTRLQLSDHPSVGYWDQTLIDDILKEIDVVGNVVIIPGGYQAELVDEINQELAKLESGVVMVMSDEESLFPVERLYHPNMRLWVQYPKSWEGGRYLPAGYSPDTLQNIHKRQRNLDWVFTGQVTHEDRRQCVEQLRKLEGGYLLETEGFTQGLKREDYFDRLCHARLAVCPNGTATPDTLRLYEALEAGCVPIVGGGDFFPKILGDFPFPHVGSWAQLPEIIKKYKDDDKLAETCKTWWINKKTELRHRIEEDLWELI